jgi:anti-sigma regulatory factor (Ser/Thr protein kinase)
MATDDTPGTHCTGAATPGPPLEGWMYVDNDPIVAVHNRALLKSAGSAGMRVNTSLVRAGVVCAGGGGAGAERVAAGSGGGTWVGVPVPPFQGQGTLVAGAWPLRSFLELGAYPGAVPCARLHTRAVVWEWGLGVGEAAELVVCEIATNAVQASPVAGQPGLVRLWLLSDGRRLLILVWDASPHPPVPAGHDRGQFQDSGWGLMLVDSLSDHWSWYAAPEGKVVWALCSNGGAG